MTTKKKTKPDLFYQAFVGEAIQILCKSTMKRIISNEEEVQEIHEPMAFEGILLDTDETWLFIGESGNRVCSAVKIDDVNSIHILQVMDAFNSVLDAMPEPEDENGIN